MKHVVAFDVSMGKSTMVIYNEQLQCNFEGEVLHTRPSFEQLHGTLQDLIRQDGQAPEIVFEATGVYSQGLEKFLQDHSYSYCRINPLEANLQMASMRRQKTDLSDAHELAKTHFKMERRKTHLPDDYYEQMRALTRYYEEIGKETTQLFSRLHAILQASFPGLESLFTTHSALFLNLVQCFPHPEEVLACSKAILRNRIKASTSKNLSLQQVEEKGLALEEMAHNSYPAISRTDVRCTQARDYAKRLGELLEKKKQLVKQMEELSKERIEYQILMSFPGIGKATAVRIIGELGDIRRFQNHKQLNAYVGIDIMRYQSGTIYYNDRINKRGNRKLRKILFFMINTMIALRKRTKNHLVDYYDKLKTQPQRKAHKVAVIACMNKFLKVAFHLIQQHLPYDYETASTRS